MEKPHSEGSKPEVRHTIDRTTEVKHTTDGTTEVKQTIDGTKEVKQTTDQSVKVINLTDSCRQHSVECSSNLYHPIDAMHLSTQCNKTFQTSSNLFVHNKRSHISEKPYVCAICDRRYKMTSDLHRHELIHISDIQLS